MSATVEDFIQLETALDPHLLPSGEIAFRWNHSGVPQAYRTGIKGGSATQITDTGGVIYGLAARPGHEELLYIADDGGDEQFQLHLVDFATGGSRPLASAPAVINNLGAWSADGRLLSYASNQRDRQFFDVYVLDVDSGTEHLVYQQDGMNGAGRFSPNGRALLISRPNLDLPGDNDLFIVPLDDGGAATGEPRRITEHAAAPAAAAQWSAVALFEDGSVLAVSDEDRDFVGLQRIDGVSGEREYLRTYDWDIEGTAVAADRSRIAIVVNEDGYSRLEAFALTADAHLGDPVALPELPHGVISGTEWSTDGSALVCTFEGAQHLSNVWYLDTAANTARVVTANTSTKVDLTALPEPELIRYPTFDGREIPAFYYRPAGVADGDQTACLVLVHGGPEGQSRPFLRASFAAPAYLLTQSVAILVPNVRGSTGYGKEYSHADDVELRMDSVRDLIAATDWLSGSGGIDPDRIGVMGGSYGGFMVLAAITEAPDKWGAAIDLFGIADFETFLKFTGPWRRKHRAREYGADPAFLKTISPIHKADQIQTPLLVIQGDHDVRVPPEESEQIVDTVRHNEGVVEYVVYPEEGHGIQKLPHRLDMGQRIVDFCTEHLLKTT